MGFSDYLMQDHIFLLDQGISKTEALNLLALSLAQRLPDIDKNTIVQSVWQREEQLSTRIAPGIAIPHATLPNVTGTYIAVGVCAEGMVYDAPEDGNVHLLIMIIGEEQNHLKALSDVAQRLQVPGLYDRVVSSRDTAEIFALLTSPSADISTSWEGVKLSRLICRQALDLATAAGATAAVIHGMPDSLPDLKKPDTKIRIIYAASGSTDDYPKLQDHIDAGHTLLSVPFRGLNRARQVEISILLALSKGLLNKGEKVVSVFGMNTRNLLDTIVFTDIEREFKRFFSMSMENGSNDIQQEVFIRVLQLSAEIAHEGREGKPVGTLFVIGDYKEVLTHCQQMIANPFKGYEEHERNILDPGLSETIKEFAQIDGAFIIRGDGVIASAGTYLRVKQPIKNFPSGLGARHAAAAGITGATRAVAVAISESTRKLSLFSTGERIMEV